jgi:hypothetical protein
MFQVFGVIQKRQLCAFIGIVEALGRGSFCTLEKKIPNLCSLNVLHHGHDNKSQTSKVAVDDVDIY